MVIPVQGVALACVVEVVHVEVDTNLVQSRDVSAHPRERDHRCSLRVPQSIRIRGQAKHVLGLTSPRFD